MNAGTGPSAFPQRIMEVECKLPIGLISLDSGVLERVEPGKRSFIRINPAGKPWLALQDKPRVGLPELALRSFDHVAYGKRRFAVTREREWRERFYHDYIDSDDDGAWQTNLPAAAPARMCLWTTWSVLDVNNPKGEVRIAKPGWHNVERVIGPDIQHWVVLKGSDWGLPEQLWRAYTGMEFGGYRVAFR